MTEIVCDTPLKHWTRQFQNKEPLHFTFSKNKVVLEVDIESPLWVNIGDQVDVELDGGKYTVPFKCMMRGFHNGKVELWTTTQKCVDWLIKRYNVTFDDEEEK